MTPEQKAALESLVNRPLTETEIADIEPLLPNRQDVQIANVLSAGRVRLQKRTVGNGDVLDTIGLTAGNLLLDAVYSLEQFRHVRSELERGDLDMSRPIVRQSLDALVWSVTGFTQADADALKALAEMPDPINFNAVSDVLNVAEGRITLENF